MVNYNRSLLRLKSWLRSRLTPGNKERLKNLVVEPLGFFSARNLPRLAMIYGTDKWGMHWYAQHYQTHFKSRRRKKMVVFEIGVGGYQDPKAGGGSLRMWRRYFPNAQIVGLDYYDKSPHAETRIRIYQGDQSDEALLKRIVSEVGRPDIIIDDGSHVNAHVIKSFEVLFPLLADDGIYAIEDTQTAYFPDFGGLYERDSTNLSTSMNRMKDLIDGLNFQEYRNPAYQPTYYDQHITSMTFYHNLVLVQKGINNEGTSVPILPRP